MTVSVIIPAYNEERFISKVIGIAKKNKEVNEVIVVDNNSTDRTSIIAKECGARVVTCKKQGKGYAMEKGIKVAKGDVLLFLDGDICNYKKHFIGNLIRPVLEDEADFVKSTFNRSGGRVTELLARPLLEQTFPKLKDFEQPLSGIIAGKKELFQNITLTKDYGVDVGILIDVYEENARIIQVNIGKIKNVSQDWHSLIGMSREVTRSILTRYEKYKKRK